MSHFRDYFVRFNMEIVQVREAYEKMQLYLMDKGLYRGTDLHKAIGTKEPRSINEYSNTIKKTYIRYEEKQNINHCSSAQSLG